MTTLFVDSNGLSTAVLPGRIQAMPESISGEEYLTTSDAQSIARQQGVELSLSYISRMARDGRIVGSRKIGEGHGSLWLLPQAAFIDWLGNRNKPGRPKDS